MDKKRGLNLNSDEELESFLKTIAEELEPMSESINLPQSLNRTSIMQKIEEVSRNQKKKRRFFFKFRIPGLIAASVCMLLFLLYFEPLNPGTTNSPLKSLDNRQQEMNGENAINTPDANPYVLTSYKTEVYRSFGSEEEYAAFLNSFEESGEDLPSVKPDSSASPPGDHAEKTTQDETSGDTGNPPVERQNSVSPMPPQEMEMPANIAVIAQNDTMFLADGSRMVIASGDGFEAEVSMDSSVSQLRAGLEDNGELIVAGDGTAEEGEVMTSVLEVYDITTAEPEKKLDFVQDGAWQYTGKGSDYFVMTSRGLVSAYKPVYSANSLEVELSFSAVYASKNPTGYMTTISVITRDDQNTAENVSVFSLLGGPHEVHCFENAIWLIEENGEEVVLTRFRVEDNSITLTGSLKLQKGAYLVDETDGIATAVNFEGGVLDVYCFETKELELIGEHRRAISGINSVYFSGGELFCFAGDGRMLKAVFSEERAGAEPAQNDLEKTAEGEEPVNAVRGKITFETQFILAEFLEKVEMTDSGDFYGFKNREDNSAYAVLAARQPVQLRDPYSDSDSMKLENRSAESEFRAEDLQSAQDDEERDTDSNKKNEADSFFGIGNESSKAGEEGGGENSSAVYVYESPDAEVKEMIVCEQYVVLHVSDETRSGICILKPENGELVQAARIQIGEDYTFTATSDVFYVSDRSSITGYNPNTGEIIGVTVFDSGAE